MGLSAGTRLGPYEIVAPIGAGGMGEVWRATDTRLGRSVAIKVLSADLAKDPQLRMRLEREAKTISHLNHPNICTIYDVGDGYLVMELLEGETLAERLRKGSLPVAETLNYAIEIASALDGAHRAGVVHRDLKPGNIILTRSGAKLVDFGIAKNTIAATEAAGSTVQKPLTREGTIVGTFHYMAPEQLEGRDVDHRADIWAFGCVLYEMITGHVAFTGTSQASLLGAILRDEPEPISNDKTLAPPVLVRLLQMCLAKNREDRWQNAHDLVTELRWTAEDRRIATPSRPAPKGNRLVASLAAVAILGLALLAIALWRRVPHQRVNPMPVVVLMDSTHPLRVYDPETRAHGGTNADDLTDLLHDLPVVLLKENTTWTWHREDEVLRQNPDLILVHRSCFYVPPPGLIPAEEAEYYARAWDKLELFLGYVALENPRTKFVVYSRRSWADAAAAKQWTAALENRFPALKGRVRAWPVPLDRATFRNPQTGAEIKSVTVEMLGVRR